MRRGNILKFLFPTAKAASAGIAFVGSWCGAIRVRVGSVLKFLLPAARWSPRSCGHGLMLYGSNGTCLCPGLNVLDTRGDCLEMTWASYISLNGRCQGGPAQMDSQTLVIWGSQGQSPPTNPPPLHVQLTGCKALAC